MTANTAQARGLASRDGQRQECECHREQQAVGVGTVTQALQRLWAKAPRGDHVIEIQGGAAEERKRGAEDTPAAAQHDW